jgi:hypothetical protein
MTQQWLRQLSLIVAKADGQGIDFGKFWCTFTVRRGDMQTPNSLDARIYNLSRATAQLIQGLEFTQVQLGAGYNPTQDANYTPPVIFSGTIRQFRAGRVNNLDSYVDITAADGDEAYNFAPIFVTVPAKSSSQPQQIANAVQAALNEQGVNQTITAGYAPNFPPTQLVRGRVLYGMARDEAREFAWQNNVKWSIQDGAFTLIPYTSYIPGGSIPLISVQTGLIGVPEQTQQGIHIRVLLNPAIKVGQLVQLDSQVNQFRLGLDLPSQATNPLLAKATAINQQGLYYVMRADHTGDTREQNWYSDLTCLSVDASIPSADAVNALFKIGPVPIDRYGGT